MSATYTREQLVELYPEGSVSVQTDEEVRPMTDAEWNAWIDAQVGQPIPPLEQ